MEFYTSETSRKLGKISEVMADGFYFVHMREQCQQFREMADAGDNQAITMMWVVDTFHRLCVYIEETAKS